MYCPCVLAHDSLSGLGESVSMLEKLPKSPGIDVPHEMGNFPQTLGRAATHDHPPAREGGIRRKNYATTIKCK